MIECIAQILSFVLFPFFLSLSKKLRWRVTFLVFGVINLVWLFLSNFSFDEYEKKINMFSLDPIISEYSETFEELSFKEEIPVFRVFYRNNKGLQSGFWIRDITSPDKTILDRTEGNQVYIKSLKDNIDILDKKIATAKYQRNKELFLSWKNYFQNVQSLCNVNEFSGSDVIKLLNDYQIAMDSVNGKPRTIIKIDINPVVKIQATLKMKHNATVEAFGHSEIPVIFASRARYFLGFVLEGVYLDFIQKPKSRPYTDRFNPIESGL